MGRVLVMGGQGQLGADVVRHLGFRGWQTLSPTHDELDVQNRDSVREYFLAMQPQAVVNCAAVHDLNLCETQPALAFSVNGLGAQHVAQAASLVGAYSVYVSTDYVFDGAKATPYVEEDDAHPLNVYGQTKRAGEEFGLAEYDGTAILRVSAIYGKTPCRGKSGHNFVERMISAASAGAPLRVVNDEFVSPTSTVSIARQVLRLLESRPAGVFHGTSQGMCTWYEFTAMILQLEGLQADLEPASAADFPTTVRRPKFSVLDNRALRMSDLDAMPAWQEALAEYLSSRGRSDE